MELTSKWEHSALNAVLRCFSFSSGGQNKRRMEIETMGKKRQRGINTLRLVTCSHAVMDYIDPMNSGKGILYVSLLTVTFPSWMLLVSKPNT